MTRSPMLHDPDMLAIRAKYSAALSASTPELLEAGSSLLDTLSEASWTLEWYLPRWLGDAFDLPHDRTQALVLANVYGLGYIRLQDDLADERMSRESSLVATCLASLLYRMALQQYLALFDGQSRFWRHLDRFMAEWLRATLRSGAHPAVDLARLSDKDLMSFAARGAPLKICCAAACLLGERDDARQALLSAVDHTLLGHVLLDHIDDWQADLAGGRFNLFVAYASPMPQTRDLRERNTTGVMMEWYGDKHARPYFALVRRQIRKAAHMVQTIPCPGLSDYLLSLEARAAACATRVAEEAKERLQAVVAEALRPATALSSPSRS